MESLCCRQPPRRLCVGAGALSPEKGGALRKQSTSGRRLGVAALLCGALFGVPLLLLQNGTVHAPSASAAVADHVGAAPAGWRAARGHDTILHTNLVRFREPVATTTSTTAVPVTTTTAPPTTTTTTDPPPPPVAPVTTTTETPAPVVPSGDDTASGEATYYASDFPASGCASPYLPKGTVLTVTATDGASVVCTVDDREADNAGRVVDLSPEQFEELAPLGQGVVEVTVSW